MAGNVSRYYKEKVWAKLFMLGIAVTEKVTPGKKPEYIVRSMALDEAGNNKTFTASTD